MAFLTEETVRLRARRRAQTRRYSVTADLAESARSEADQYDVFLCQTIHDPEIVLGVYDTLVNFGFSVFCDWVESPKADRAAITPANARYVRRKMQASNSLIFLDTEHADQSKWMCWELGWFDGAKGKNAILPILSSATANYRGREFLGLYPYLDLNNFGELRVNRPSGVTVREAFATSTPTMPFKAWLKASSGSLRP